MPAGLVHALLPLVVSGLKTRPTWPVRRSDSVSFRAEERAQVPHSTTVAKAWAFQLPRCGRREKNSLTWRRPRGGSRSRAQSLSAGALNAMPAPQPAASCLFQVAGNAAWTRSRAVIAPLPVRGPTGERRKAPAARPAFNALRGRNGGECKANATGPRVGARQSELTSGSSRPRCRGRR